MGTRRGGRSIAAAFSAVAVTGAVALLLTACGENPTDALSKLAHLDKGVHASASGLPPVVPDVDSDIVDSSLRLLAEAEGTEYWVGVTHDDDVCFIARTTPTRATEATCVDADRFGRSGAMVHLESPARRVWLHTEYMTLGPGWRPLSASVAVRE
jgi:hypothetical protein